MMSNVTPGMELPLNYHQNRLVLMVQEPTVLFAYWELSPGQWQALGGQHELCLRVYEVEGNGVFPAAPWREVSLPPFTNNWYFQQVIPDRAYVSELGCYGPDGQFYPLLRSNRVSTPRVRPGAGSWEVTVQALPQAGPPPVPAMGADDRGKTYSSLDLYLK